ncbi:MAG: hypothetical protein JJU10_08795 [Idiomarina sp.]|nr:hypothetical protein [Idiomarina sp.]
MKQLISYVMILLVLLAPMGASSASVVTSGVTTTEAFVQHESDVHSVSSATTSDPAACPQHASAAQVIEPAEATVPAQVMDCCDEHLGPCSDMNCGAQCSHCQATSGSSGICSTKFVELTAAQPVKTAAAVHHHLSFIGSLPTPPPNA